MAHDDMTARRKSKLTPEIQEQFCSLISNNSHFATACKAIGIAENSIRSWIKAGADEMADDGVTVVRFAREPFRTFRIEVEKAQAIAELVLVDEVRKGGWKGAAWLLSRRYGERWREQKQLEMVGAGGSTLIPATPAIILVQNTSGQQAPWVQDVENRAAV